MKICLVSPYDYANAGGVGEHITHLARSFRAMGHTVKIIAPTSAPPGAPIEETGRVDEIVLDGSADSGGHNVVALIESQLEQPRLIMADPDTYLVGNVVKVRANGSVARITLSMRLSGRIKQILRQEAFDVVHLHEPLMPALPLTVLLHSKALNIGTFHAYAQSNMGYFYLKPILRLFVRRLHGRIAVSPPAAEFISQYFGGDYEIIPNGIDEALFADDIQPLPQFMDGKLNILFLGRFNERRKGVKFLLRAFIEVKREIPNARLIVAGKGKTNGYQRYLNKHGISDVIFTGFVSDEDKSRYYKSAHVYCSPAIGGESFGIVLLEAMAVGTPIVASNIPGYASVITHGKEGALVEPKNHERLAMALIRMLSDSSLRERMGAAGRATATDYSWPKVSRRIIEFYERTGAQRRSKPTGRRVSYRRRIYNLGSRLLLSGRQ